MNSNYEAMSIYEAGYSLVLKTASADGYAYTHTKTMPGGEKIDIVKLVQLVNARHATPVSLQTLDASRSPKHGFSSKRYNAVDTAQPVIVDAEGRLMDGRHRVLRARDAGMDSIMAHTATPEDVLAATLAAKTASQAYAPVYHYAPPASVDSIMTHGLAGNKGLVDSPELLKAVAMAKGVEEARLLAAIRRTQTGPDKDVFEGPNVMFSDVSDAVRLADAHPLRQNAYAKIQIDLESLLRDTPDTKMYGIELGSESPSKFLEDTELRELQGKKPEELWRGYSDPDNEGYYAPNVPHASIHTPTGIIAPKYLKVV